MKITGLQRTVRRPQVFLMDEPLSNLDAKLRAQSPLPPGGAATLGVRPQHARWAPGPGDGGTLWIPAVVEDRDVGGRGSVPARA